MRSAPFCRPPASAIDWLFQAADETLPAFVSQPQPRQKSISQLAIEQLDPLNESQLRSISTLLSNTANLWHEWNSVQPGTLHAFCSALACVMVQRSEALTEQANPAQANPAQADPVQADCPPGTPPISDNGYQPVTNLAPTPPAARRKKRPSKNNKASNATPSDTECLAPTPSKKLNPDDIIARFLALQPESGNENQRRRAVHKALLQTDTADIGILVSRSNLHARGLNPLPSGQSRLRSLLLVPDVFCRMGENLSPIHALQVCDILQTTETQSNPEVDERIRAFRMTLVCGLFGHMHRLHLHRLNNGQVSNWPEHGQGLLHFNFRHILTGLGEIPELATLLQDAFCECLLDAGKRLPEHADLQTVWAGPPDMIRRTGERVRQLVTNPEFLGLALAREDRFNALIGTLSIVLAHAKLIMADPLRKVLAASILDTFAKALLSELAPFSRIDRKPSQTEPT